MAIVSGYYNSVSGDRKYNAETMSKYFQGLFSKGVLQNYKEKLVVTSANEGMKIKIPTGKAYFSDGKFIEVTAAITEELDASDVLLDRIDCVVLRSDKNTGARAASVVIVKGANASNPVPPVLQNTDYVEELCIAQIRVNHLAENITQANITNTIPDNGLCGYVTGIINQVDTTDLYMQYATAYQEFKEESEEEFSSWFESMKETLKPYKLTEYKRTITSSENQSTINVGIAEYNETLDVLSIFVNGFKLDGDEYEVDGNAITLKKPLYAGNKVEIVVYKSTAPE